MGFTTVSSLAKNPLRFYRYRNGLTQKQLAKAVGISESMICQIENREVIPSLKVAYGLCQVTGVSLEALAKFCLMPDITLLADSSKR